MRKLLTLLSIATLATAPAADQPPNIVLVLVDDLGWMDLSCQGSDYYKTPNIDALATGGIRFTNAYAACAVCSPTRAAVQTGRYPGRTGITDWIRSRFQRGNIGTPDKNPTEYVGGKNRNFLCPPNPYWMEHSELTIAEALQPAGYKSAYVGKWHLGDPAWYPEHQGFDKNVGGCDYGQPPSYFDPYNQPKHRHHTIREGIPGIPGRNKGEFLTHREADEIKTIIHGWKDEPFFIAYSPYAVHTPIQAIEEVAKKYEREGKSKTNARYAALVESVDDAIGTIVATLDELSLSENTLIIFTSDNGGLKGPTDNTPLRSGKGYAYEGGIRVPLIAKWPGNIPAGTTSDAPVSSVDIFPTLLQAARIDAEPANPIDGISLTEHLKSGGTKELERDELLWHFPHYRHDPGPYSIIRKGDLKLIKFWDGNNELYDLKTDLAESKNLAGSMPEKAAELEALLVQRLEAMDAKLPRPAR